MTDSDDFGLIEGDLTDALEKARAGTNALGVSASAFANAMTGAFAQAAKGGKQFDDVLRQVALRLSGMAVSQAFKSLFGTTGGTVAAPRDFPLISGGFGGTGGPEWSVSPLTLSEAGWDGGITHTPANIAVHIATPDAGSFRRSEAYITGQIARAVARGQRGM